MVSFGWVLAASRRAPKSWSLRRGWNHHCLSLLWGSTSSSHWVVTHLDPFLLLLLQLQQYKSNKQKWILPTRRSQPEPNPLPLLNHTTPIPHRPFLPSSPTLIDSSSSPLPFSSSPSPLLLSTPPLLLTSSSTSPSTHHFHCTSNIQPHNSIPPIISSLSEQMFTNHLNVNCFIWWRRHSFSEIRYLYMSTPDTPNVWTLVLSAHIQQQWWRRDLIKRYPWFL